MIKYLGNSFINQILNPDNILCTSKSSITSYSLIAADICAVNGCVANLGIQVTNACLLNASLCAVNDCLSNLGMCSVNGCLANVSLCKTNFKKINIGKIKKGK